MLPYNDIDAISSLFATDGEQIAAVIVEPVAGNMGCVPPALGFLEALRSLTSKSGALLVLDEVMTGFRVAYGGAQALYGIALISAYSGRWSVVDYPWALTAVVAT